MIVVINMCLKTWHWGTHVWQLLQWKSNKYDVFLVHASIHHAKLMYRIAICGVTECNIFFQIMSYTAWFLKKVTEHRICVFILSKNFDQDISHSKKNWAKCDRKYRVSQEECAILRESVPNVKVYRYNPKHLYPKLNGYGDNGQGKVRSSCGSTYCTCSADALRVYQNAQSAKLNQYFNTAGYSCAM